MQEFLHGTELLFTSPIGVTIFVGGLIGGLVFGAIPGLNVLTLAAVLLPFTAWFPAEHAIMLYGVIYVSGVYGGAITAILFNIPGSVENAPTAFDGYHTDRRHRELQTASTRFHWSIQSRNHSHCMISIFLSFGAEVGRTASSKRFCSVAAVADTALTSSEFLAPPGGRRRARSSRSPRRCTDGHDRRRVARV